MKLRNPIAIRLVALLMSWVLRLWLGSLTFRTCFDDGSVAPERMAPRRRRRGVYVFWHEMLLVPTVRAHQGFTALASQHADGELIAQVVRMLRGRAVRGSTSKAGLSALRGMLRGGRVQHLAITVDGPRGPRRVVKQGAVYLASKTGMPVVPVGFALRECWRIRSWDRMALPKPGTVAVELAGEPIDIPPNLDRDGLERQLRRVQDALDDVQRRAEALARGRAEARDLRSEIPRPGSRISGECLREGSVAVPQPRFGGTPG
jgi:lysophospholipid acyltransferase (LPLAT)-like uncharacterized protein